MSVPVVTAADGAGWESALVSQLAVSGSTLTVVRRCLDVAELAAVAASGQAAAAVVDARLRRLDAEVVTRIAACAVAVVGVCSPGADMAQDAQRLSQAGIAFTVAADSTPAAFSEVVQRAIASLSDGRPRQSRDYADPSQPFLPPVPGRAPGRPAGVSGQAATGVDARVTAGSVSANPTSAVRRPQTAQIAGEGAGRVVVVWGPTGAPGRTSVAANLAAELAGLGESCLLVDADVYGGVLANVLGLLEESPGLVAACRHAQSNRLDLTALSGLCWQLGPRLRVLTGASRADRWPEIRPGAVERVLQLCRQLAGYTVVDLGFCLETDEELSYDTLAPRRNGATLTCLDGADLVLAVGAADPVGMQRLVRGLGELHDIQTEAPTWVILNRVRPGVVPGNPERELDAALRRFAGRAPSAFLPYDRAGMDAALSTGKLLGEVAPDSALRRSLVSLAAAVAGRDVPPPRRRWRRSTVSQGSQGSATRLAAPPAWD